MSRLIAKLHMTNLRRTCRLMQGFGLVLILFCTSAHALKPPVVLNDTTHVYSLSDYQNYEYIEYLEDPSHELTIREVSSPEFEDRFVADSDSIPGFRETDSAFWIRFQLKNESYSGRRWVLDTRRIRTFVLRQIIHFGLVPDADLRTEYSSLEFFIPWAGSAASSFPTSYEFIDGSSASGPYFVKRAPVDTSFAVRALPGRYIHFLIPDSTDWDRPFYIRFNHENVLSKRIRVWSLQELYRFSRTERIASGIFFGVIAALVCYNLFLFISLRDRSYLYYFLYLVHISLFIAAYQGMGFEYLWPDRPGWNRDIMYALVGLAMCFAILFTRSFLDTPGTVPRLDRVLVAIAALAVIGSVGSYWNVLIGDRIAYIVCVSLLITCFTAGILSWLGGFLPARYYLTAWSVLIISSFVYILDALGVYRYPGISSMNTLKFGVTCEALLLSLGLASRIKILDQQVAEQEAELETASRMQLGLMPQESPQVPGYEIAGRCLPATHVGGDLYQYFQTSDELLAISLADVTGHAMEAAIPVVMFSGILQSHVEMGYSPGDLIKKLNSSVHNRLGKRTFVCFALGELNTKTGAFKITNAGIPFPYHYRSATRDVQELEVVAFPLGIRLDTEFSVMEVQLEPGDRIVFCSDGIMESANSREDFFGFDRTAETIRQGCRDGLDAEALVDRLIDKVKNFCGEEPQKDDITCVVLRVEEDLKNEQE